ncbi:MAG TPA: hypothetical protein VGC53_01640, partial [Vicinamibacteria bacterium]
MAGVRAVAVPRLLSMMPAGPREEPSVPIVEDRPLALASLLLGIAASPRCTPDLTRPKAEDEPPRLLMPPVAGPVLSTVLPVISALFPVEGTTV